MANANQGRGKSAFREFKRELNIARKEILASFASDFRLSPNDIQNYLDLVYIQYVRSIEELDLPNPQIWVNRGNNVVDKEQFALLERLQLPQPRNFIEPTGEEFTYEVENPDTGSLTSFSIPIILSGEDRLAKAGIVIRKRLIPPEELEEYVSAVPYPIGIQPVFEDGVLKGYRLWVQK